MSNKEMTYTEDQLKAFLEQSDMSIVIMRKDLGKLDQTLVNFQGSKVEGIKMIVEIIVQYARILEIEPVELSKKLVMATMAHEMLDDDDASESL